MTYKKEFPMKTHWPRPAELIVLKALGFEDVSWHNDSCPSWQFGPVTLYIAPIDPKHREQDEETRRFATKYDDGTFNGRWASHDDFVTAVALILAHSDRSLVR